MRSVYVVMPFKNSAAFIESAARSVLSSIIPSYLSMILLAVDDGSEDGSASILKNMEIDLDDRREMIIIPGGKLGPATARNTALQFIKYVRKEGDLVAFCDSDDVWDKLHLYRADIELIEHGCDMHYSDVRIVDEDRKPLSVYGIPYYKDFDKEKLKEGNFIFISTVVMKAECISVGDFSKETVPMEDWDYWLRVSEKYKIKHWPFEDVTYLWKTKTGSYYTSEQSQAAKIIILNKIKNTIMVDKMITEEQILKELDILRELKDKLMKERNYTELSVVSDKIRSRSTVLCNMYHNLAKDVPGWLSEGEGRILYDSSIDNTCLEVGSFKGKSACYIAPMAKELTCIDTFSAEVGGQVQAGTLTTLNDFMQNTAKYSYKIIPIIGSSFNAHSRLKDEHYDMVFIDAMHDYESVFRDIRNYWPKVKSGGRMLLHDYGNKDWTGVEKAALEILGKPHMVVDTIAVYMKSVDPARAKNMMVKPVIVQDESIKELIDKQSEVKLEELTLSDPDKFKYKVAISAFAQKLEGGRNPKDFPYWEELIDLLRRYGVYTIQVGSAGEGIIGADEMRFNLTKESLKSLCEEVDAFISVDTFFQHFATYYGKRGVVIFSKSDPKIFGHSSNVNILKSAEYLRARQYGLWKQDTYDEKSFVAADQVHAEVMKLLYSL